jgi:peptide/nickel transport system substrate-binding protein
MLTAAHQAGSPLNASQWEDREFDLLVRAARSELDTDVRRALYVEVQHRMRDHGGVVVPAFMNFVQAANTRIGVPDVVGNLWPMDNGRMAERWWRA